MRNFKIIDIGDILGSKEARPGVFKEFCEDVLRRRLDYSGPTSESLLSAVFGQNEAPGAKAQRYVKSNPSNVIGSQDGVSEECAAVLREIAARDPLSARLGAAWFLQQAARREVDVTAEELIGEPWNHTDRRWWKKERSQQALLQIAASQRQRMKWYGPRDVVALSGANILVFLSICQFIWAEYRRTVGKAAEANTSPKGIPEVVQDVGIHEASSYWFRKIKADPNGGDDRHRFSRSFGHKTTNCTAGGSTDVLSGRDGF